MAQTTEAVAQDGQEAGPKWVPTADTTVDSLLAVAGWQESDFSERGTPWAPGHAMHYSGVGGMRVRDNRRITVAADSYSSRVDGGRNVDIEGDATVDIDENTTFAISPSGSGSNRVHVKGNLHWQAKDKLIFGTGLVNRTWYGPVRRLVPMEGIICGGAFTKAYLGTSNTTGALATGDVFGGAARTSASRSYVSGIGYRSADNVLWQLGLYTRQTHTTLEPVVGSPSGTKPFNGSNHTAKLAARIAMATMPFVAIATGLVMLPVAIVMGLAALVGFLNVKYFGAPRPVAPAMQPRVRNRTVGVATTTTGSYTET